MGDAAPVAFTNEEIELRRLRWRCRRGMRELDILMTRYVDSRWAAADADERDAFLSLLVVEDDRLWRWFMGREAVPDDRLQRLVSSILTLPARAVQGG
ncbi:MAG: succinate dehydrogenase assembly factor 2 [Xanthomonadaceae bacterium]|nr:succinate dehydrogenase assembly factor 2 [Xanthomonadaceae bacterium]